jgi:uncharacterized protein (TIGR03435 family)
MPEGSPTYTLDEFMKGNAPGLEKMLQSLLADRLQLLVRHVIKEVPGYALVPGKGGPKLKASVAEDQPRPNFPRTMRIFSESSIPVKLP